MYVVHYEECESINGKIISGRASRKVDDPRRKPVIEISKCHGEQVYNVNDFSFKDTNPDILRFGKQRPRPGPTQSQELHPEQTNSKQPSRNWKQH
jgi:hypothetical protein